MKGPRIVVVGSPNSDLVAFLHQFPGPGETVMGFDFKTFCGGKGANQAYAAGKLGARTAMVGQVGDDLAGQAQIRNLASVGVDTTFVFRHASAPTGTAVIGVDDSHQNRIIVIPGANGTLTPGQVEQCGPMLSQADFVLLQLEIPLETVEAAARLAKTGRAQVILDPAPAAALSAGLLRNVDYLTPNLSELCTLTGEVIATDAPADRIVRAARSLCAKGVSKVIAKLGERGAMLISASEVCLWPALAVTAVDTTAAGDAFNAAFAAALVEGRSETDSGAFACAAAAFSVTRAGAQVSMPTRSDVEALRKKSVPKP